MCQTCNMQMQRIITPTNFKLAGSGWPGKDGKENG